MAKKTKKTKKTEKTGKRLNRIMTPKFTASYAHVFEPTESMSGDMKYSLAMVFKKGSDLDEIKAGIRQAIISKWGTNKADWPKNLRTPLRSGNDDRDGEGIYKNAMFMNASSNRRPGVVDSNANDRERLEDDDEFYSGCIARATIKFFPYDKKGNRGVGVGLQNIQKLKDGTPLDGRVDPNDDFDD
jgi:hypothetical protein